ncbi:TetR/AcrR family transcriptional regulator [Streptomyces iconiensis]|uniref:TetR/AcrR family transcriptional regulator C-terminal domain-containing protein n=1 Tax=Streptomyces iconiensis TaxID=1384038 RepID=A0ABT6ZN28_9ACTN|nr:TetR/AcrR family transcriptional regulator C-terminal domain-containing protein [Streptomyces iconiensis]MDJ1130462.1 TetR/AcrR family transcriptional regulator C-terminal domain-containing protein [Streptomyces iconiensis]
MAKEEQAGTGLPPGVEIAWGLRERPGKGPARGLDVERIVAAAIAIADKEGLAAVSMSRVASDVGVSTMALYRYVARKDDLLMLMEDAAAGTPVPGPPPEDGWRAGIAHWARAYHDVLRRHLWIVRIPISTPPLSPHGVEWMEQALSYLRGTTLHSGERLATLMMLSGYVRSHVALLADIEEATRAANNSWEDVERHYWTLLAQFTDPHRFPAITEMLHSGELEELEGEAGANDDSDFEYGLTVMLNGIQSRTQ